MEEGLLGGKYRKGYAAAGRERERNHVMTASSALPAGASFPLFEHRSPVPGGQKVQSAEVRLLGHRAAEKG